jgi:SAM-dependent methyltransferase
MVFHEWIGKALEGGVRDVLDIGCGRGMIAPFPWRKFEGVRVTGIDPDPTAAANPSLTSFLRVTGAPWPLPEGSFDLAVARYVLEHVVQPKQFLMEVRRVLRPGGSFIFLTPNVLHPAIRVSSILATSLKKRILKGTKGLDHEDVFPTWYRMNTRNELRQLAASCGLTITRFCVREFQPVGYLDFSVPTFFLALLFWKFLRATHLEDTWGGSILACLRKTEGT